MKYISVKHFNTISSEQFDPKDFRLCLIEALKDPQIIASVNKMIDGDAIKNIVSTEINHSYKALENELKKKDDEIDELKRKNAELEKRCIELEQYSRKNTLQTGRYWRATWGESVWYC